MKTVEGRIIGTKAALLCGVAALILSPVAVNAQQATQTQQQSQQKKAEEEAQEIVVVGSRIRRDNFNTTSQVQVITREESTLAGLTSAADVLQSSNVTNGAAQINNAFGGFVTNGGPGANTISLRGLGAGRTLVLINGRRVAPAGTRGAVGSADLNVLPSAVIERIDILRDGASSIYGSDAIAGVVNVITRTDIDGIIVEGQYNRPLDKGGEQGRFSLVGGTRGDRWQVAGSLEYYERGNLTLADRDWTKCNLDYRFDRATGRTTDFIDPLTGQPKCYPITGTGSNGVTINTLGTANATGVAAPGAVGTVFNRWRPNAAVTTGLAGFEGVGGGLNSLNVRDTFDARTLNRSLISPTQNWTGFGQASYESDILGDAEFFTEVLATRRQSQQTGYRQLSLDYPQRSPLVPVALQPFAANFGSTLHSGIGLRAFIGFGNDQSEQTVDFYKATAGVRGDVTFLPGWKYELDGTYSKSDAKYSSQSWLTDRLANSVNVVTAPAGFNPALVRTAANGTSVTCAVNITNPNAGCIPAPILNTQTIGGQLPRDWVDYTWVKVPSTTKFDDFSTQLQLDGPLFELPAGKVQAAVGIEYRWSKINDTPNENSQTGNLYNLTSAVPTRGKDNVIEGFAELEVPVLKDLPFAKDLTINGSARYTEYNSYGGDWTHRVGAAYTPIDWLTFRGTVGTSFRAPALFEQFQGATSGFLSSNSDPCNNYGAPGVNPNRVRNCASELPGQPTFQATNSVRVLSQGGADTGLFAETSDNYTVGGVLKPTLPEPFGEFAFAVDYFSVEIQNGVQQAGAGNILALCYDDPAFRAGGGLCNLVTRAAGSNALTVINSYTNIATAIVKGFDYNLRWSGEVGPGTLRLNAAVTRFASQASKVFKNDPLREFNGILQSPEMTGEFNVTYRWKEWTVRYGIDWTDATDSYNFYGLDKATTPFLLETPNNYLHRAAVQYQAEDWGVTVGVRNLFDKEPPKVSSGAINLVGNAPLYSGYDYVGRQVFVNFTKSF